MVSKALDDRFTTALRTGGPCWLCRFAVFVVLFPFQGDPFRSFGRSSVVVSSPSICPMSSSPIRRQCWCTHWPPEFHRRDDEKSTLPKRSHNPKSTCLKTEVFRISNKTVVLKFTLVFREMIAKFMENSLKTTDPNMRINLICIIEDDHLSKSDDQTSQLGKDLRP